MMHNRLKTYANKSFLPPSTQRAQRLYDFSAFIFATDYPTNDYLTNDYPTNDYPTMIVEEQ